MKLLMTTATAVLIASQAFAGSYEVRCETKKVPYQEVVKGGSPEKVIGGALVGGVIGKVVTDKNAGAAAGAIVGGVIANETSKKTVTKYREVETCTNVFIPERITDEEKLQEVLLDLNEGKSVSKEITMDAQYTIGVAYDGKWGPKSRLAAEKYLANLEPDAPLYSLVVNDVVIVSSADVNAIDEIKEALLEAGVASQIFVDLQ
ncbi:glycine zipper 2TM domain-containing protein [Lutimaribacter saemankumensis]|uniref:Glycine zipper 2TM domain-containing protein n=1 Tax=Lutimaribacter saemankumensis TaxID=490829 RepID=A0A1G8T3V5_9RHOB|nr:glycine zipper 2TM domain-containing protein [Lutimaribacter saemankumensis]SDJ36248.1 Glycine zipper 2TM domain-containing protein [Lutimaribacter saemankumensis]